MDNKPKVTVITVCRNNKDALQLTMHNVSTLQYPHLEYIVIDGKSTDGTLEQLEKYQGLLNKWVSEPDNGIYDAMNKGTEMATGEWVIFMNAGDTFADTDVLSRIFGESRQDVDVIYGDVIKGDSIKVAEPPHNAHRMYFCHQSALVRRKLLLQYPFDTNHRMSADFKQMKTLFLKGYRFQQLSFPVARFDLSGVSNTSRSQGLRDNIAVIREVDNIQNQLRLLPKLYFVYFMCRIRGK